MKPSLVDEIEQVEAEIAEGLTAQISKILAAIEADDLPQLKSDLDGYYAQLERIYEKLGGIVSGRLPNAGIHHFAADGLAGLQRLLGGRAAGQQGVP